MKIIAKFGGSSVSSSTQFQKVKNIVTSNKNIIAVVSSAIGKCDSKDTKVTDLLYLMHAHLSYNVEYKSIWNIIKEKFYNIKNELNLKCDLEKEFLKIENELNKDINIDYLVSRGEFLTSLLLSEYLDFTFIDSKDVIKFNYDGSVDYELTSKLINEAYMIHKKILIPGFYGTYPNNDYLTFSRGGSDITGSIVAVSLNCDCYENWTDVSGMLSADPKIVPYAKAIKEITYEELRELSYMGASILHQETVNPVRKALIPIKILNTNAANEAGTIINENSKNTSLITGIAGKQNYTSINITKNQEARKIDVIQTVLNIFSKYKIDIEHLPSSIDSFSVIIQTNELKRNVYEIINEISKDPSIIKVDVENNISLIAIVGKNMIDKPGISGKIFSILGSNNINIKMIAQGSYEIAIILGVSNTDFEKTIKVLYDDLINDSK